MYFLQGAKTSGEHRYNAEDQLERAGKKIAVVGSSGIRRTVRADRATSPPSRTLRRTSTSSRALYRRIPALSGTPRNWEAA